MKKRELDVVASETGFAEDTTHDRVVENRENEVLEFDFQQRRRLMLLLLHHLHKVEAIRVAPLVCLGALYGGHEGVRDRGTLVARTAVRPAGSFCCGEAVEGDADGELEGAELETGGVGATPAASAGVAKRCGGEREERGDGVEGGGLGVAAAAGNRDGIVERTRRLVRQTLPRGAYRRRHRRRAYMQKMFFYYYNYKYINNNNNKKKKNTVIRKVFM